MSIQSLFWKVVFYGFYASYIYNYLNLNNPYTKYINNFTTIMEIMYWFIFVLLAMISGIFIFASKNSIIQSILRNKNKKAVEALKKHRILTKVRFYMHLLIDTAFILFVGLIAGDISLFIVLSLVTICHIIIATNIMSLMKEIS